MSDLLQARTNYYINNITMEYFILILVIVKIDIGKELMILETHLTIDIFSTNVMFYW